MRFHSILLTTVASTIAVSGTARAQDAATSSVPAPAPLQDIVVTAQKRSENLQRVPIAITAYTGDQLTKSGVENTADLQFKDPSLVFTTNAAFGQPYLRGVGSDLFTPGAESSIATFVDDVYLSRSTSSLQDLYDVQRVDVVKGPQGVLFGRNATGGAINIYTNKPTNELGGYVSATYGNYDKVRLEGALNVPLDNDNILWRVSGLYASHDGYTRNVFNGTRLDDQNFYSFRSHLDLRLAHNFSVLVSASYSKENDSRNMAARVDTSKGLAIADFFGALRPAGVFNTSANEDNHIKDKAFSLSATAQLDLGGAAIKSISAYRSVNTSILLDLDASQLDFASNAPVQASKTYSQELQVVSQGKTSLEWIAGIFYLHENASQQLNVALSFPAITGAPSDLLDQPGGTVKTNSVGLYANAKYHFSDQFAVSAGVRYNHDARHLDFLENVRQLSTNVILAAIPLTLDRDFHAFTPRFVLEYTPSSNILIYASASRGYKAGGFNTNIFQPAGFGPESLWAYEGGIKATFADGRARINSALFYYDYKNLQLNTIPPGEPVGSFQIVINAAAARIKGLNTDATFAPVDDLQLNVGLQLLDAKFRDFSAINPNDASAGTVDRSGARMPRAPKVSLNVGAQYTFHVENRDLTLRGDYHYESRQYLDPFQDPNVQRDANSTFNANLTYDISRKTSVSIWGRNLTNEKIVQSSLRADGLFGTIQFFAPPRTFGATLKTGF